MEIIALVLLSLAWLIQFVIPKASDGHRRLFGVLVLTSAILAIFSFAFYQSWQQYLLWKGNEVSKFFLPPYQNWDYFIFYARSRFFNPYLLSLFIGLGFLWAAKKMNQKYDERFFEPIEPYLFATAIFLTGHPLWLFYLIILLASVLLIQSLNATRYPLNAKRLSLYYLWLPTAIFTILISKWLTVLSWWASLKL